MSSGKIFIAIAGNIGTGKTTLTRMLSDRFGWKAHFEAVSENPYLSDFYRDMMRWSFPLQVYFLTHRFQAHQLVTQGNHSSVQDRSIYEDANIFARNLYEQGDMEERDYKNYVDLYNTMCQYLTPPDLIIYLRKSIPTLKQRIAQRGREYERDIPDQYLLSLNRYYDDWMETYNLGKKLIVPSDSLDFIGNSNDFDYLTKQIINAIDQKDLFLESPRAL